MKILGAGIAFGIGLRQYRKTEAWKRIEFVAAEMNAFYENDAVREAMTMLDWLDWRKKTMALSNSETKTISRKSRSITQS